MPILAELIAALEARYDPALAEPWDAVGLVCGDQDAVVDRVLFAVDPVTSTVSEAIERGAGLLVTHHPLFLSGVHGVPASDPKGVLVHRLITAGCALFVAHTNADRARPGVSDALADAVGLVETDPLEPADTTPLDRIVTYAPTEAAQSVVTALSDAGAGVIGDYTRAAFLSEGVGTFVPGVGANPAIGSVSNREEVGETRIEMVLHRTARERVVRALLSAHPYEEPAYSVVALAALRSSEVGLGRIGELGRPLALHEFAEQVTRGLPPSASGIRVAGDPDQEITIVAVCGGSGGSLIETARRAGADAFLTSDLRHHVVSEAREDSDLSLLDASHWATEWPWIPAAARLLRQDVSDGVIEVITSNERTDPWTFALGQSATQEASDGGAQQR